jgi:uncharacterized membrane protein
MKSKLGIALSWILVFLLGAIAGTVGHCLYTRQAKPAAAQMTPPKPGEILDKLADMLQLDAQQKESLKAIFANSRQKYQALHEEYKPRWEAIRDDGNEQIKQILRPDQKAKFEAFLEKVAAKPPNWRQRPPSPEKPK